ncbi:MAG: hypothetical protein AABY32_03015 [Nanoarchaeota archaeon]
MAKGLVQKVAPWIFGGLVLVGTGCSKTYEIDGSKVKGNPTTINSLIEYRGDSLKIRYSEFGLKAGLCRIYVNGKKYTRKDTPVFNKANEHYNYLCSKIDSIKDLERKTEEQKRIDFGLKAFE